MSEPKPLSAEDAEYIARLLERLEAGIAHETKNVRFGSENPRPANSVRWAMASVLSGNFLTTDWACQWIRYGYPEPPEWMCRHLGVPAKEPAQKDLSNQAK